MKYFNESMTRMEALDILYNAIYSSHCPDGLSKEEVDLIKAEYSEVIPKIIEREFRENDGWMTE